MTQIKKQVDALLDSSRFWAWLGEQKSEDIVGHAHEAGGCPLACYLRALTGELFHVGNETVSLIRPIPGFEEFTEELFITTLPVWAQYFVGYVDCESAGPLTAQAARDILEKALQDATPTAYDPDEIPF